MRHLLALLLVACATKTPVVAPAPAPAPAPVEAVTPPPPAPTLRLSDDVIPKGYALDLTVVPSADTYTGTVDIDVELARPLSGLWMHATEITITEATASTLPATPMQPPPGDDTHVGLRFPRELPAGPAKLHIAFQGKMQDRETRGLFKQKDGDDWYAFTHFETTDASRAFPCFDDPRWKTPWHVTLHVKKDHAAFSNTPVAAETADDNGMKTVSFAPTKPLPTYLVAFAAGPFVAVDAGKSKSGAPVRILALKGREREAAYAAEVTAPIVSVLEEYFASPYPFEKLDSIAVPQTVGFSAMENPGLITYNDDVLLARPEEDTMSRRRRYASIAAHEIAHMWFGDLVTLAWWDDTWLNESFASWAASKTVEKLQPGWGENLERVRDRGRALGMDTLESTRAVRQPIKSEGDIENAFDRITYSKGEAVLEMFEAWLGPEVWRKGVQDYLRAHAYGNATAGDFFGAISAAAGRDVTPVLSTFIDQPGAPLVTAALDCPAGGKPLVKLSQERYVLPGAPASERRWKIPVCVHSPAGRACTVLEEQTAELALPDARCPAWIFPNAGGSGYYRSALEGKLRDRLVAVAPKLPMAEQIAFVGDLGALQRASRLPAGEALAALPRLSPVRSRHLAEGAVALLDAIRGNLVTDDLAPRFARYVNKLFGARARALGFVARPGESEEERLMRAQIVPLCTVAGRDPKLGAEARALAFKWLDERRSVPPDSVRLSLRAAAATNPRGDRKLLERLIQLVKTSKDPAERAIAIDALGAFEDPAMLTDSLALMLDDSVDVREVGAAMYEIYRGDDEAIRVTAYHFLRDNYDKLVARLPRQSVRFLLRAGILICNDAGLADYQTFFGAKSKDVPGGGRIYSQTVEGMKACIAMRQSQRPSAAEYLRTL